MTNATIQLQSFGRCPAKPVSELQIGDVVVWNFGATSEVTGFIRETKAQIVVQLTDKHGVHERRMGKSRLIGIKTWA